MFDQYPTVRSPEGHFVSQTAASMQYVGRSNNFAPEGVADDALALSLTMGSEDVRNKVWYKLMVPSVLYYVLGKKFGGLLCFLRPVVSWWFGNKKVAATLPKHLAHFENHLAKRGSDYFVGSQPCYGIYFNYINPPTDPPTDRSKPTHATTAPCATPRRLTSTPPRLDS